MAIKVAGKGATDAGSDATVKKTSTKGKAKTKAEVKEEVAKAEAGMEAEAPVEQAPAEGVVYGSKSSTVTFVAALGDPSRIDTTQEEKNGPKRKDPTIVGYCFVSSEDINVPDIPPNPDESFAANLFSFDPKAVHNTRPVKAGEQFNLTKAEAAMLISRDEYNSLFTGGSMPIVARYTKKVLKDSSGKPVQVANGGGQPEYKVSLSARDKGQSIKDIDMIPVLKFTTESTGKSISYKREILPGFEKWADLCVERKGTGTGTRTSAGSANKRNPRAAEFLAAMMGSVMENKKV